MRLIQKVYGWVHAWNWNMRYIDKTVSCLSDCVVYQHTTSSGTLPNRISVFWHLSPSTASRSHVSHFFSFFRNWRGYSTSELLGYIGVQVERSIVSNRRSLTTARKRNPQFNDDDLVAGNRSLSCLMQKGGRREEPTSREAKQMVFVFLLLILPFEMRCTLPVKLLATLPLALGGAVLQGSLSFYR